MFLFLWVKTSQNFCGSLTGHQPTSKFWKDEFSYKTTDSRRGSSWPAQMSQQPLRPGLPLGWLRPGGTRAAGATKWARMGCVAGAADLEQILVPTSVSYFCKKVRNATWSELQRLKSAVLNFWGNNGHYYCQPVLNGQLKNEFIALKKNHSCDQQPEGAGPQTDINSKSWSLRNDSKGKAEGPPCTEVYRTRNGSHQVSCSIKTLVMQQLSPLAYGQKHPADFTRCHPVHTVKAGYQDHKLQEFPGQFSAGH